MTSIVASEVHSVAEFLEPFGGCFLAFSSTGLGFLSLIFATYHCSFRYDLNQIPYDYIVEVRNRFKGLDLIDRVPDELWNEVCDIEQETGIKTIHGKEMQKSKMAVWGGLTNSCEKKRSEKQRRKGKI